MLISREITKEECSEANFKLIAKESDVNYTCKSQNSIDGRSLFFIYSRIMLRNKCILVVHAVLKVIPQPKENYHVKTANYKQN